jgi:hypothetical protein
MRLPKSVIGLILVFVILGTLIPVLWPMLTDTSAGVGNMTGGGAGGDLIKVVWPVALLLIGIGIAVALILFTIKKFGSLGRGR